MMLAKRSLIVRDVEGLGLQPHRWSSVCQRVNPTGLDRLLLCLERDPLVIVMDFIRSLGRRWRVRV